MVAEHQVLDVLSRLLCTYACGFEEFLSTHEQAQPGWPLNGTMQLVLTDPPYNLFDLPHDRITGKQMLQAAALLGRLVRPGGHAVIFCSADQIGAWRLTLRNIKQPGTSTPCGGWGAASDDAGTPTFTRGTHRGGRPRP